MADVKEGRVEIRDERVLKMVTEYLCTGNIDLPAEAELGQDGKVALRWGLKSDQRFHVQRFIEVYPQAWIKFVLKLGLVE